MAEGRITDGRWMVIGIGHRDRGDDAIGRIVADRLRAVAPADATVVDIDGEAGRLLDLFDGAGRVVIVDAARSGATPGTVHRIDVAAGPLPSAFSVSTHAMGLADSVELARAIGRLPARCIVYAIEGASFALGAPPSPAVTGAVDEAVAGVLRELAVEAA